MAGGKTVMKRISALLVALLLILAPCGALAVSYDPPSEVYVADYANVIDSETERYIIETGRKLDEKTGAQIVIMTVNFVDGDFEDFCYDIFNSWGIGDSVKNNGILLVMSIGDQDAYCLQGAGLEKALTSGMIGDMMNEFLADDFFSGNYSAGARHIFDALCDWLCSYYDVSLNTNTNTAPVNVAPVNNGGGNNGYTVHGSDGGNDTMSIIMGIIAFVVILIILIMVIRLIFRPRYRIFNGHNYYWSYHRPSSYYSSNSYGPNTYFIPGYNPHSYHSGTTSSNSSFWYGGGHSPSGSGYSSSHSSSSYSSGSNHSGSSSHISHAGSSHSGSHISHSSSGGGSHSGGFGGGGSRGGGSGFGKR